MNNYNLMLPDFLFLKEYLLSEELFQKNELKTILDFPHHFYTPYPEDIPKALETFKPFPVELKLFYEQIGFGFMHRLKGKIYRILDPISLIVTNLELDECRYDKELKEVLKLYDIQKQLLFFQSNSKEYFVIDCIDHDGKNAIYHKRHKVADSLNSFINQFHKNKNWIEDVLNQYKE